MFTAIDLSQLPPPDFVEPLSFETIFSELKQALQAAEPDVFAELYPSDPAFKLLEVFAYRELLLRNRMNEKARQCLLAYATGANLDHIGALFGVGRLVLDAGNPTAIPPIPPTLEPDDAFRARIQLAPEGFTNAGSVGAYRFHALSASGDVVDVGVDSPSPGIVRVVVLGDTLTGIPHSPTLSAVSDALNADTVRPLCDTVQVIGVSPLAYDIVATLTIGQGPDASLVRAAAIVAVNAYATQQRKVGATVALSGLYQALHQPGVERVTLTSPVADVVATALQAPILDEVTIT